MARGTADWDAQAYDRLAAPQEAWAREVLDRLPLRGDETVLDAGCGSGRVTKLLLERLPRGHVIGVDGSESMIAEARRALAGSGDRVALIHSDLLDLELEGQVDVIFSNAVFHWIFDHEALFRPTPSMRSFPGHWSYATSASTSRHLPQVEYPYGPLT